MNERAENKENEFVSEWEEDKIGDIGMCVCDAEQWVEKGKKRKFCVYRDCDVWCYEVEMKKEIHDLVIHSSISLRLPFVNFFFQTQNSRFFC